MAIWEYLRKPSIGSNYRLKIQDHSVPQHIDLDPGPKGREFGRNEIAKILELEIIE